jgi:hypothetical protein
MEIVLRIHDKKEWEMVVIEFRQRLTPDPGLVFFGLAECRLQIAGFPSAAPRRKSVLSGFKSGSMFHPPVTLCFNFIAQKTGGIDAKFVTVADDHPTTLA